ncbi:hypothetical protein PFISCL1PPCAC_15410 [Pristionchus fissidentatus]|uniref:DNA-directed primase/polymerase protein n=1 Tax=Pristionchus fissidentatus TaxID=1538716 RepID=A0AAV5W0B3_9BILA|nr:hypothetical protein PFISCL1PPCAC_15410 [Pristionchus fissidentatus]
MWKNLSDGLEDEFQRGTTPARNRETSEPPINRMRREEEEKEEEESLRWYSRQREAMESVNRLGGMTRIFTQEDKERGNGARRYLVTTVDRFWREYCNWKLKHHYELISEHERCRLYFDLEFERETNEGVDEIRCLDHFIHCCILLLSEMFDITVDRTKFLLLDSSSPVKFSMHIIVHFPSGLLFPSSPSIRHFADRLRCRLLIDPPFKLKDSDGDEEIVIFDLSVYTRNRNFRLFLSSKLEKRIPFVRSLLCTFYPIDEFPSDQQIFLDSLCVPVDWRERKAIEEKREEEMRREERNKRRVDIREGADSSPFPLLDEFILSVLSKWRTNESIRKWTIEGDEQNPIAISYYPSVGRFCFNIGREHKSNGTYWRVDLDKASMVQRCFDIECRGICSNAFPIPLIVMKSIKKIVNKDEEKKEKSIEEEDQSKLSTFYDQWDTVFEC